MERRYLIGVDIGTQGTKASLYTEDGKAVCHFFRASELLYGIKGEITQDPDAIYESVIQTVKKIMEISGIEAGEVAGLGIDAQMAGIMGIDRNFMAVTPYDSWLDTRCEPYIGVMKQKAEEEIIRKTGGQVTYSHGPKMLWWKEEHPEVYRRIAKFVTPGAYVCGRLCGLKSEDAFMDYTHLHFTGFADNYKLEWDEGLAGHFKLDRNKLPRIAAPWECAGRLGKEAAEAAGLTEGMPVAVGCGDSAASSLGAGILEKGMIYDVAGTASIFSVSTDRFAPDLEHRTILTARSAAEGLYIPLAYLGGGGLCIRWFRQLTGKSYEELENLASAAMEEIEDLFFIPHFAGRTCPNVPEVRGGFTGLAWNHTAGHLYGSILESIALEYNEYFTIWKELDPGIQPKGMYGVGGGTHCRLFNQLKADVMGIPYHTIFVEEAATWGSAMLAGVAVGLFHSLQEAGREMKVVETYEPRKEKYLSYREKTGRYEKLLSAFKPVGR